MNGSGQSYGEINGGFTGPGLGLEVPAGKHWSASFDVNAGFNTRATAVVIEPAIHYLLGKDTEDSILGRHSNILN